MKQKILFAVLFTAMLFFSCSKSNDIIDEMKDDAKKEEENKNNDNASKLNPKSITLKLTTPTKEINIFEMMKFSISIETTHPFITMLDLHQAYDSVIWKVSGVKGESKILKQYSSSSHFIWQWGHHFFAPGNIETYLIGYKNNTIIHLDTLSLEITNKKDFLGYNWKEITEDSKHTEGYVDALSDVQFSTFKTIHDNIPGVRFYLWDNHSDSDKILSEYITKTYSEPVYTHKEADLLLKKYHELFHYKREKAHPQCMWITPTSKIVLLRCTDKDDPWQYQIYAEPK